MSWKAESIMTYAKCSKGMQFTKKEAVELIGHTYYHNASFHVGNVLSRLVNSGRLQRVKKGVYKIAEKTPDNPNQGQLF